MTLLKDHIVRFTPQEEIEKGVEEWLNLHFLRNPGKFSIIRFIEDTLLQHLPPDKGAFVIFLHSPDPFQPPAYVTFNPFELHVDETVWASAGNNDEKAIFILAHEIGHVTLHNHMAQAFSPNLPNGLGSYSREQSAEWQANTFAQAFVEGIKARQSVSYNGDACGECGNFTLVRNGTCLKCDTCGSTMGCS